jgi:hypothetical protein
MPVVPSSSPETSQITTASLLTDLLEVFQSTPSSAPVGIEKDNHLQLPLDSKGRTPPNSPCITPLETVARIGQLKESTGLLVPSTDGPSAYSIYADESQDTARNREVSGNPKLPVTGNNVDVASSPDVGPLKDGQSTPSAVDITVADGERLVQAIGCQMWRREKLVECKRCHRFAEH